MNGLISLLIREGAALYLRGQIVRRPLRHVVGAIAFYSVIALLGLVALGFFYLFLYRWIADAMDPKSAAAILCAGNVLIVGLAFLGRALVSKRRSGGPEIRANPMGGMPDLDAALALGRAVEKRIRKSAPEMTIAAAVIGLAVGARPELLDLFLPRRRAAKKSDADDKE